MSYFEPRCLSVLGPCETVCETCIRTARNDEKDWLKRQIEQAKQSLSQLPEWYRRLAYMEGEERERL